MPTYKSNNLKELVLSSIEKSLGHSTPISLKPYILLFGNKKVYLRVAVEKSGYKYWFDVNPSFFDNVNVDFLIYACGSEKSLYVFPPDDFFDMIKTASLGGVNQVPNFTIYIDSHELESAGKSKSRYPIKKYWNNLSLMVLFNIVWVELIYQLQDKQWFEGI